MVRQRLQYRCFFDDYGRTALEEPLRSGRSLLACYWVSHDPFHPEARGRTLILPDHLLKATGDGNLCINTRALQCRDVTLGWATVYRHIWNIAADSALLVPFYPHWPDSRGE